MIAQGGAVAGFDHKLTCLKYSCGGLRLNFEAWVEQAREGSEGLHARRHAGPFDCCTARGSRCAPVITVVAYFSGYLGRYFFGAALLAEFLEEFFLAE